jgi:2-oxoglutarate dehydrogenase E2 component (dihydrolipoamide succinyltransferase)
MATIEMKVPSVGESISEVTIGSWAKKEGDTVKRDEVICSLDSDKTSFEVVAESDGVLHIKVAEGETIPIGTLFCVISPLTSEGGVIAKPEEALNVQTPNHSVAESLSHSVIVEMKVPSIGESIAEVTIANWTKKDGDVVKLHEIICELESDKASFELPAEAEGILTITAPAGTVLPIGALICKIQSVVSSGNITATQSPNHSITQLVAGHPSPAAAKILAEKGVDTKDVAGSGVGGRITKDDAVKAAPQPPKEGIVSQQPLVISEKTEAAPLATKPMTNDQLPMTTLQRREKMSSLRKTIARRLVAVKNETAMLTTFNEVDMKPIMDLRTKFKDKFKEKHAVGLGFMSFFTKAVCVALQEFPVINAYIDGDEIVYNDFCDISIAVSAPRGLVVPVIRSAQDMSFAQVEAEIVRLATLAKENKLTIDQMQGGTFTITNGGTFGSMLSTPIINAPQAAILGMHNIVERAVVVNGEIVVRPIMYVALSYDHRTIDGKDSVSFLVRVKQLLEDPTRLLLGV